MKLLKKYYFVLCLSAGIFVMLIIMNADIIKKAEKRKAAEEYNKKMTEIRNKKPKYTYGYTEIIKDLKDNNFVISDIGDNKKSSICIQAEFSGNLKELNDYIDKLSTYKNFVSIDNITITGKNNKIAAEINFLKNK